MSDGPDSVEGILDRLVEAGARHGEVSVGDVVEALGHRSYGPFLMVPALMEISPLGVVPGVPTLLALIVVLFAAQMALGRRHFWLPQLLARRRVPGAKLRNAAEKIRPVGRWMDRWFHGRLTWMTRGPFVRFAAVACILLAMAVPPLEVVPFASSAPMAAIALFGLALLARDGALMIVAGAVAAAAVGFGINLLLSGGGGS